MFQQTKPSLVQPMACLFGANVTEISIKIKQIIVKIVPKLVTKLFQPEYGKATDNSKR